MDALARPIVPPAPYVHRQELPIWRLVLSTAKNSLGNWAESSFDALLGRRNVFGIDSLLVNDPKWVRHVLHANLHNYVKPPAMVRPVRPLAGEGVLLAEGPEWKRQRRMLAPAFTPASVGLLLPHFQAASEAMVRRLEKTPRVDLSEAFHQAALDAVLRALFSLPVDESRTGLAAIVRDYLAGPGRPNLFDGFARAEDDFGFALARRRTFRRHWFKAVDSIIAARKAAPAGATHGDLLDLLLAVRDPETGAPLSDVEIRDQCATMLLAGFETTSRLLFWCSYLLTLDPTEQARLRQEVTAFPPEKVASLEDLQHWPRLKQALCETLRLYPPVPVMLRRALGPDTIGEHEIGDGTLLWISPWVIHRHRAFWEHPTAFMPDRFAGKGQPWVSEPAFLPFSAGPRICIGASFAMAEASIVLATLLARFELSLDAARPILPVGGVTTAPDHEPLFTLERIA
ncbi:cytochrome P450 [Caulobacter mirabilis]|uniref:Cytochrome P450 n=1 Tax=Caulobacter mirabilis TaxID=69666 RepID=A0A2D2AV00_9CAUL|nr:cytochrome P450 [Caulobacter mirabilis]ATQ41811.1 cytochrome P450 [Caulobacter mirabilis]